MEVQGRTRAVGFTVVVMFLLVWRGVRRGEGELPFVAAARRRFVISEGPREGLGGLDLVVVVGVWGGGDLLTISPPPPICVCACVNTGSCCLLPLFESAKTCLK